MSKLQNNITSLQSLLEQVNALPEAGGVELPTLINEGSATDLMSGKELIDANGNKVTGTFTIDTELNTQDNLIAQIQATLEGKATGGKQATPVISVDNSNGLITATAGTKSSTYQLTSQPAKTITPSESSQTAVTSGVYTTGAVTVAPIPNEYIITTDATANANEIMNGETAYVNGNKITGTFSIDNELTTQDDLIAQIQAAVDNLPEAGSGDSGVTIETVTGTVGASGPPEPNMPLTGTVHYMDANGAYATLNTAGTILVMKDSILFAESEDGVRANGGTVLIYTAGLHKVYRITDDFNIYV